MKNGQNYAQDYYIIACKKRRFILTVDNPRKDDRS